MTFYLGRPISLVLRFSENGGVLAMARSCGAQQSVFRNFDEGGGPQSTLYCSEPANRTQ